MNRVCPNVRHENITLWSFSWRLKFIRSQFPLPMALNSEQKEIFIQYSQQVLYVHARRVLSIYTCMIFILRETRTTVREWACCHSVQCSDWLFVQVQVQVQNHAQNCFNCKVWAGMYNNCEKSLRCQSV
jgi:hypothetical protein